MVWLKNRTMVTYAVYGFLGGVVFLFAGLWIEITKEKLPFTLWAISYLHRTGPVVLTLDLAPFLFALLAGVVGFQRSLNNLILQSKKEWETTFDAFSDPTFVVNEEGNIVRCNHAFIDRLNSTYSKVIGRPLS